MIQKIINQILYVTFVMQDLKTVLAHIFFTFPTIVDSAFVITLHVLVLHVHTLICLYQQYSHSQSCSLLIIHSMYQSHHHMLQNVVGLFVVGRSSSCIRFDDVVIFTILADKFILKKQTLIITYFIIFILAEQR